MKVLGGSLLLVLIALSIIIFSEGCFVAHDAATAVRTISRTTLDGNNILSNYEWYYNTYNDIKSKVSLNKMYTTKLSSDTLSQDIKDKMIVEQTGINAYIFDLCQQYNSRSSQVNRNLFKANELPASLSFDGTALKESE